MRVAVFFLYLCFILLKGDAAVYAVANPGNGHTTHQGAKHHRVKYTNQNGPLVMDTQSDNETEYISADEDLNNEDSNDFLAKKMRLLARSYADLSYDSILSYHYNFFSTTPPFYGPKSDIYILQRTLRI